ncbi:hypothetical protein ACJJTC_008432 [Scirpophaga incertulas]
MQILVQDNAQVFNNSEHVKVELNRYWRGMRGARMYAEFYPSSERVFKPEQTKQRHTCKNLSKSHDFAMELSKLIEKNLDITTIVTKLVILSRLRAHKIALKLDDPCRNMPSVAP